jgi:1,4-alpha-glucan branching enzyme
MAIKKQSFKSKPQVKVTFSIPSEIGADSANASIIGDFNGWNAQAGMMNKLKSGEFKATLEIEPNQEYQFRYLLDGKRWENEPEADKLVVNEFGTENSVLVL